MKYEGCEIKRGKIDLAFGGVVSGYEILIDGKRVTIADTIETAKRYIDNRRKSKGAVKHVDDGSGR